MQSITLIFFISAFFVLVLVEAGVLSTLRNPPKVSNKKNFTAPAKPECWFRPKKQNQFYNAEELSQLSDSLFQADTFNYTDYVVSYNIQDHANTSTTDDFAPDRLLILLEEIYNLPSTKPLFDLYDNYHQNTSVFEHETEQQKQEQDIFLDNILKTPVMSILIDSFIGKGIFIDINEIKKALHEMWFELYPRRKKDKVLSSSGFEHIFLSEIRAHKLLGMHNWFYYSQQEKNQNANYLGYIKTKELGNGRSVIKFSTFLNNIYKPWNSMFIGTSPEFEMAIYTLCFIARPEKACKLKLGSSKVNLSMFTVENQGKCMIATGFPEI